MAFESIRKRIGRTGSSKQYVDDDNTKTPSEIQDPHTWRDETATSFRDKIAERKFRILSKSLFILVGSIVLAGIVRRWVPEVYYSQTARYAVGLTLFVATIFFLGAKWQRGQVQSYDWLVLNLPDRVEIYLGKYDATLCGDRPGYKPVAGFSLAGTRSRFYTLGEMSDEFARHFSKKNRQAKDPVRMGLPDQAEEKAVETWFGKVISVVSDGFDPVTSEDVDILVLPSSRDHEETMESLIDRLQKKNRRIDNLEDELSNAREEKEKYRAEAKQTRREVRQELQQEYGQLLESVSIGTRDRRQSAEQQNRPQPTPVADDGLPKEVAEAIADD